MPTGSPDLPQGPVERAIRTAMDDGEFDDLAGSGKPIPGAGSVDDDLWWVRCWIQRNRDPSEPNKPS
ncbi:MAG: DUF1992 domain-containing protein [Acidimicrobiia bacterium]